MTIGRLFCPLALSSLLWAASLSAQTPAPGGLSRRRAGAEEAEGVEPRPSPRWYRRKFIPTGPSRSVSGRRRPLKCSSSAKSCKAKARRR